MSPSRGPSRRIRFSRGMRPPADLRDLNVTVMGLGLFGGGKGVTEFLVKHGARVTVTDRRSAEDLEPVLSTLRHLPVRWMLGEHREEDFLNADLVIASPAVPRDAPLLRLCESHGVPLDTEMNLFFKNCAGKICAVTGSNGKTTTTSLLGAMASRRWPGIRVGGNLGRSLLPEVDAIEPSEWVILEMSSFQLEDLASIRRRPHIAVVTNVSPNHLDRHGTYDSYLESKRTILEPCGTSGAAILNGEDPLVRSWRSSRRETLFFGRSGQVTPNAAGLWIHEEEGVACLHRSGEVVPVFRTADLALPGRFNLLNCAAAAAAACVLEVEPQGIAAAVRDFRAVEHRLEPVAELAGIQYINDSMATTPESTVAAVEALGPALVVICGGSSKGSTFLKLGQALSRCSRAAVLIGETAEAIESSIPRRRGGPLVERAASLKAAVLRAEALARPGDRVLLSPACASYDMFLHFAERGQRFKAIVGELCGQGGPPGPTRQARG